MKPQKYQFSFPILNLQSPVMPLLIQPLLPRVYTTKDIQTEEALLLFLYFLFLTKLKLLFPFDLTKTIGNLSCRMNKEIKKPVQTKFLLVVLALINIFFVLN